MNNSYRSEFNFQNHAKPDAQGFLEVHIEEPKTVQENSYNDPITIRYKEVSVEIYRYSYVLFDRSGD